MPADNTMFPGRPGYTGPREGWFGPLHHAELFEWSHDVMERVNYVKARKPPHEVVIRLHNMIYLGGCLAVGKFAALHADYRTKLDAIKAIYADDANLGAPYDDYRAQRDALFADYEARRAPINAEVLAYIREHIPDCAWNGSKLVFTKEGA